MVTVSPLVLLAALAGVVFLLALTLLVVRAEVRRAIARFRPLPAEAQFWCQLYTALLSAVASREGEESLLLMGGRTTRIAANACNAAVRQFQARWPDAGWSMPAEASEAVEPPPPATRAPNGASSSAATVIVSGLEDEDEARGLPRSLPARSE